MIENTSTDLANYMSRYEPPQLSRTAFVNVDPGVIEIEFIILAACADVLQFHFKLLVYSGKRII